MFSLPTGTEMFHFPALPPNWLYIHQQVTRHHSRRVSPFGHPRIHARLTAPRGISQPPTSFIGSQCQGIHHAPLNTYNTKPKNESPTHTPERMHAGIRKIAHQTHKQTHHRKTAVSTRLLPRCSQPLSTNQTPHPTTKVRRQHANPFTGIAPSPVSHTRDEEIAGLLSQSPIVCLAIHHRKSSRTESRCGSTFVVHRPDTHYRRRH